MRLNNLGALVMALMVGIVPAYAQEQSGAIEGTITDATGAVVPGATVEARSASGMAQNVVSDQDGRYNFPALPGGNYTVTGTLTGFTSVKVTDVRLGVGQTLKVDLTLRVSSVEEVVTVTGEAPVVDVSSTVRSTSIRDEQIDKMPKGRDFTTLATQAPGANIEFRTGGLSIDGASSSENKYIIDGVETNDPETGLSSQLLVTDMVEEVQVKSSGYEAEYSGAVGGVVNVITKSGTNDFKGSAWAYFSSDELGFARGPAFGSGGGAPGQAPAYADSRPSLRLVPTDANQFEHVNYPKDDVRQIEPGFAVGGPLVKDKVWFFGSYNPTFRTINRDVTLTAGGTASGKEQRNTHYITGNLTAQATDALRARWAFNSGTQTVDGLLPTLAGSDLPGTNYDLITKFPSMSSTLNLDYVVSPKLFLSARGGYFLQDTQTEGNFQGDRYQYQNSNINGCNGCPAIPAQFRGPVGYQNTTATSHLEFVEDKFTRMSFQTDATWFVEAAGKHEFKFGVQYDKVRNQALQRETGNLIRIYWGSSYNSAALFPGVARRGDYGYYRVRTNTVDPERGFMTVGDTASNNLGFFIQDSWTIGDKLTLNLGVRTERERVPNYNPEDPSSVARGFGDTLFEFGFGDKIAPRVGFAYDVRGDGKTKVYGSWGLFYDIFKLALPRGSFGGDRWVDVFYTLNTPNPADLANCVVNSAGTSGVNCPGTQMRPAQDLRHPSYDYLEYDEDGRPILDPYRIQEWSGGIEHSLTSNSSVALRYVHKQIDKGIEDIGFFDAQGNEVYLIGNPGFGANEYTWTMADGTLVPAPKAVRDYDGVEAIFNRRLSNNWALRFSYLWSRLHGNYSGLTQADEPGRSDPNVGRLFDYPILMFDQTGNATFGPLPTDRTHQVKGQFIYEMPFGLSAGLNAYVASGVPVTREAGFIAASLPVQYLGRGSDGRTPTMSSFDLNLTQNIKVGGDRSLQLMLNVLNILDSQTATSRFPKETADSAGVSVQISEDDFFRGFDGRALVAAAGARDPRFLQDAQYQDPRQIRLGLRFIF
jgi:outer membrane receptor protein involved in Fe transport